jgi:hypothetical protein
MAPKLSMALPIEDLGRMSTRRVTLMVFAGEDLRPGIRPDLSQRPRSCFDARHL